MRHSLVLFLAPVLAAGLAACGGSDPTSGPVGSAVANRSSGAAGATGGTGAGASGTGTGPGAGTGGTNAGTGTGTTPTSLPSGLGLTPKAVCGPGSNPSTGLQGRVSRDDVESGRAAQGYTCNTEVVGRFGPANATGTVGGFKVERYVDKSGHDCAYYDTTLLYPLNAADAQSGVNVLDMADPAHPKLTAQLTTPAMLSPHESLVVGQATGLLAAVTANPAFYPGVVDVYDLSADCRSPKLKFSGGFGFLGHESGMSPDGKTFYSASPYTPTLTALDISGTVPVPVWTGAFNSHGLSLGQDGNRAYVSSVDPANANNDGLLILDTSEVQARKLNPQVKEIGRVSWPNVTIPQNALPFTRNGKPFVLEIDEYANNGDGVFIAANGSRVGAGRIIDISDETKPKVISDLRLEVHEPANRATVANDPGAQNTAQGYAGHYCNLPTRVNPDIVACSMIMSGLRVFDIRDPYHPKEVAYFIAPVGARATPYLEASAWSMSSPSFVPERKEIWYTDGYAGFYAVRVTNGVW